MYKSDCFVFFVLRQTKYEDLKKSVETPKGKQLQQKVSQEKKHLHCACSSQQPCLTFVFFLFCSSQQILQCYIDAVNTVMEPVFQSARLLQAPKVWNSIR